MITITPEGDIKLDGEHIGAVKDGTAEMLRQIGPQLKGQINAEHGEKLKFIFRDSGEAPDLGEPIDPPAVLTPAEKRAAKLAPHLHLQLAAMGDKTPAFVNAARDVLTPEEFQAHYQNRRIPADMRDFQAGEEKRQGKLKDEKKDSAE